MFETVAAQKISTFTRNSSLNEIEELDHKLALRFKQKFVVRSALSRALVSFQANKARSAYRWYKYKEAFSASLVAYLFNHYQINNGKILDPFAGSGTTLFAAKDLGLNAEGIELLSIGQEIIKTRELLECDFADDDIGALKRWKEKKVWKETSTKVSLPELRITKGAYPAETHEAIEKFLGALTQENERVQTALRFVLLCVLEFVSYTRKDGQYLRWDDRSGRRISVKKPFHKGVIPSFDEAVCNKIEEILSDLNNGEIQSSLFSVETPRGNLFLHEGSCLEVMPSLPESGYDAVITSPPYCNRYDYTRTYALELALLGIDEKGLINLRQQMLSCTVENKAKDLINLNPMWRQAIEAADNQKLLQAILKYLDQQRTEGSLNNNGIPRMIRGYFYEMACVIAECSRVMKTNAPLIMVNDNVRYAGASVSVDMMFSDIAEKLGFHVENILVLPNGKGNSSQQMSEHGREVLRKCVYVWRKL